jgi:hypothetical protein
MRRWMFTVFLGLAAAAAALLAPEARLVADKGSDLSSGEVEGVVQPVDEAFWIDAVDCGLG